MPLIVQLDVVRTTVEEPGAVIRRPASEIMSSPELKGSLDLTEEGKEGSRLLPIGLDPAIILFPLQFEEPYDLDDEV